MPDRSIPNSDDYAALQDAIFHALGRVVVAFSEIEFRLQQMMWYLLELSDSDGQSVAATMSFTELRRAVQVLWNDRNWQPTPIIEEGQERYGAATVEEWFFKQLPVLNNRRNDLMHSWWPDPSEPFWFGHSANASLVAYLVGQQPRWRAPNRDGPLVLSRETAEELNASADQMGEVASCAAFMAGMVFGMTRGRGATVRE